MNDLLKFEFHKIKRQKWFYISLAIMIALLTLMAVGQKYLPSIVSGLVPTDPEAMEQAGLTPEGVDAMNEAFKVQERGGFVLGAASSAMYILLSSVFIAIVVCEDFEQQIVKNIYAHGYSRRSVYLSKLICVWVCCTVIFIIIHLVAALLAVLLLGMKEFDTAVLKNIAVVYLVCMAFNALHLAVSSALRKAGGSIAICIIVPMLFGTLLGVVQNLLKLRTPVLADYWLDSFLGAASTLTTPASRLTEISIASGIYIVLFAFLGDLFSRKAEV